MALVADGGGSRGRTTPWPAAEEVYRYKTPWSPYTAAPRAPTPSAPVGLTPQQVYPYATPWSPYSWNQSAPAGAGGGVTITVGQPTGGGQPQQPAWGGGGGGGGGGGAPAPPAAPQATPTAWWGQSANPLFEGMGAPQDWLNLRAQDWAAMPEEVRGELERWLRGFGWRPGGRYGRYGALEWGRAEGATPWAQPGGYLGEQAFAGVPENLKPWLFWLSKAKGWMQGEAARPETAGWSW